MKKMLLAVCVLCTTLAHAGEITVLEDSVRVRNFIHSSVDAKFQMDTKTGEGSVKVVVSEEGLSPIGRSGHLPSITVYNKTVKVEGLVLIDDQIIYQAQEGDVDCGKMSVSRVLRRPTIVLSGNCVLSGDVIRGIADMKVVVKLKTN